LPVLRGAANPPCSVSGFGVEFFNADDRAAQLNHGSYRGIPQSIRDRVSRLFESFVNDCIVRPASFAVETTLRSSITFDQAATARREGFFVEMHYLALNNFAQAWLSQNQSGSRSGRIGEVTALLNRSCGVFTIPACVILRGRSARWTRLPCTTTVKRTPCRACCYRLRAATWFTLPNRARNGWNRPCWNCRNRSARPALTFVSRISA
jgi:hypothetical protein